MLDCCGELEPERRQKLSRHLSACPGCRRERQALLNFLGRAAAHPVPVLAPDDAARLTDNVMRVFEKKGGENKRRPSAWLRSGCFGPASGWASLAAACLIIAAIGGWWVWQGNNAAVRVAGAPAVEEQVLVKDLDVIENLDLLEEFDDVEKLVRLTGAPTVDKAAPKKERTMGKEDGTGEMQEREMV